MLYGIAKPSEIIPMVKYVVKVFGGGENAELLLLETCAAETLFASLPDRHTHRLGVGLTQIDQIALDDLQLRLRSKYRNLLKLEFGYDITDVRLEMLYDDPMLALALTRLIYMMRPEPIPSTLEGRAKYWKDHYNKSGKGTADGYIEKVRLYLDPMFD